MAVKEMSTKGLQPKLREALELEITVLRNANHRNIMTLVDVVDDLRTEQVYLILEYCAGGDLSEFIRKRGRVSEAVAKHFMTQLASRFIGYAFTIISSQRLEAAEFIVKREIVEGDVENCRFWVCEVHSTARRDGRYCVREPIVHGARNFEV